MAKRPRKNGGGSAALETKGARKAKKGAGPGVRVPRHGVVKTSGSGFHEPGRYGKAERRGAAAEIARDLD